MKNSFRGLALSSLALVFTLFLSPLAQVRAQSSAAYVYVQVQGPAGAVYGYSASATGQLTAIPNSPFKPGTLIIGGNKAQFFTLGNTTLHSYAMGSNGVIGDQLFQIPVFSYGGGSCGSSAYHPDAVLDHSGQYVYVLIQYSSDHTCAAYQTYKVNGDGSLSFDGDTQVNVQGGGGTDIPSILGNETFAYADNSYGHTSNVIGFRRESSGTLQTMSFNETDPALDGGTGTYGVYYPDASPVGNYVVFQLYSGGTGTPQLASYTVDANGNLSTTNTQSTMPTSSLVGNQTAFSPSGNFFAVSGSNGPNPGSGLEIYNFNGASPLTLYQKLLPGVPIDHIAWDTSNHLYATSQSTNKLYAFTVTSTSVTQNTALSIGAPFEMVVVSQSASGGGGGSCSTPSSQGVNVCSPTEGAAVSSPVQISATANVSGGVYRFELWNGGTKLASVSNSGIMNTTVSLAPGTYHLKFSAYNTSGTHEYATRDITVN